MKPGRAYKHDSFKDLAMLVTKAKDTESGLDLEVSWVVIGVGLDTIIPEKYLLIIQYQDLPKWKEYNLKERVLVNDFRVKRG
jgi:hypothetical protein